MRRNPGKPPRQTGITSYTQRVREPEMIPQVMLKFVDPWWYQQLPDVQVTLVPVREWSPNDVISRDQAFAGGSIGRPSTP